MDEEEKLKIEIAFYEDELKRQGKFEQFAFEYLTLKINEILEEDAKNGAH